MQPVGSGPQFWVIVACAIAIALGTYSGGWRIIKTLGKDITDGIEPPQGFAAEASTTATILASSHLGFALSTTQVASGSVIGTGIGRKGASVRWKTAGRIGLGWLITIPAAGLVGGVAAFIAKIWEYGVVLDVVLAAAAILTIFLLSRRKHVDHRSFHQPQPGAFVRPKKKRKKAEEEVTIDWMAFVTVVVATARLGLPAGHAVRLGAPARRRQGPLAPARRGRALRGLRVRCRVRNFPDCSRAARPPRAVGLPGGRYAGGTQSKETRMPQAPTERVKVASQRTTRERDDRAAHPR